MHPQWEREHYPNSNDKVQTSWAGKTETSWTSFKLAWTISSSAKFSSRVWLTSAFRTPISFRFSTTLKWDLRPKIEKTRLNLIVKFNEFVELCAGSVHLTLQLVLLGHSSLMIRRRMKRGKLLRAEPHDPFEELHSPLRFWQSSRSVIHIQPWVGHIPLWACSAPPTSFLSQLRLSMSWERNIEEKMKKRWNLNSALHLINIFGQTIITIVKRRELLASDAFLFIRLCQGSNNVIEIIANIFASLPKIIGRGLEVRQHSLRRTSDLFLHQLRT